MDLSLRRPLPSGLSQVFSFSRLSPSDWQGPQREISNAVCVQTISSPPQAYQPRHVTDDMPIQTSWACRPYRLYICALSVCLRNLYANDTTTAVCTHYTATQHTPQIGDWMLKWPGIGAFNLVILLARQIWYWLYVYVYHIFMYENEVLRIFFLILCLWRLSLVCIYIHCFFLCVFFGGAF